MSFEALQVDPRCLRILNHQGITKPTPVQSQTIPPAREGRDVVAIAQTGTGKTLAFALPLLSRIAGAAPGHSGMLVLTPTRELAQQVHDVMQPLGKAMGLNTVCVYGGIGYDNQATGLRRGADVVVATPGRLLDHIQRRNTRFGRLSALVLDEADRMLDMGFLPDVRRILTALPRERQTLMFSATFPWAIADLADSLQNDPLRIEIGAPARPVETVQQGVYTVARHGKMDLLTRILREPEVISTLVFLRTKRATDRLTEALNRRGFKAESIHGGHSQGQRQRAIEGFRRGRHKILVATDLAARGIDVQGISHVVNYDIPATSDDYIHRIGRTARANASGNAVTFVTPEDSEALDAIEKALGHALERADWEGAVHVGPFMPSAGSQRFAPRPGGSQVWRSRSRRRTRISLCG